MLSIVAFSLIIAMALRGLSNEWRDRQIYTDTNRAVAWLLQDDKIRPVVR